MSPEMQPRCVRCDRRTVDYVVTPELIYSLCATCFAVDIIQISTRAA